LGVIRWMLRVEMKVRFYNHHLSDPGGKDLDSVGYEGCMGGFKRHRTESSPSKQTRFALAGYANIASV